MNVHKTRDIYLAAFCGLEGCDLKIEKSIGDKKVVFEISSKTGDLKKLIDSYFKGDARCDPKALKFKVTDLKNQLYAIIDGS